MFRENSVEIKYHFEPLNAPLLKKESSIDILSSPPDLPITVICVHWIVWLKRAKGLSKKTGSTKKYDLLVLCVVHTHPLHYERIIRVYRYNIIKGGISFPYLRWKKSFTSS